MAHVFVTGSSTGLGRATAAELLEDGHDVVVHARSRQRATEISDLRDQGAGVVIGDLASIADVRSLADQVNALGTMDAVVHNAGVYVDRTRMETIDGHAHVFAVNVLAPYLLTAWINRPRRLIYLSSGMHRDGDPSLDDLDWTERRWDGIQAYSDSKLLVTTLAAAIAAVWPTTCSNAVDPGWVPTRMGGPGAPDDLVLGHRTQTWLAVSDDPAARVSGRYWYHQRPQPPAAPTIDPTLQRALLDRLADITGVEVAGP